MAQKHRFVSSVALVIALVLVGSACSSGTTKTDTGGLKKGGFYRIQTDGFEWNASLDPTAEYLGFSFALYSSLLARSLMGYRHVEASKGGNEPLPDLADGNPTVSADGLTYTFKIKKGVKFSPPVSRDVTSKDVKYAFIRLANETLSAGGYPSYFVGVIKGMTANATDISGIQTPDDNTIIFTLDKPTGDFLFRVSMPATAPIPEEVAKCYTKNGEYGRHFVSSGPYMFKGSDDATNEDLSKGCAGLKPLSGFNPEEFLHLVRNPNYDASTDSTEQRENFIDGLDMTKNTNTDDIFNKITANQVDGESATPPGTVLAKYAGDATLKPMLHVGSGDRTWYIFMNVTKPPFDDIHVRKAVNLIIDKPSLIKARGGSTAGVPAEHIVPPAVLQNKLGVGEFDPYATPGHAGDTALAMAEMKLSKYDANHDGICDAAVCKAVLHITRSTPPYPDMDAVETADLKKIGITLVSREVEGFYKTVQVTNQTPPIGSGAGWGKDYADASTFFVPLLASSAIAKDATQNFALVGMTAAQAAASKVTLPTGGVPSADAEIAVCQAKSGDERATCWADLDKKFMTDIVPWVPYLWANNIDVVSSAVTKYEFDQFSGEAGFAHIALDVSKQVTG